MSDDPYPATVAQLMRRTRPELSQLCRNAGLDDTGTKAELAVRYHHWLEANWTPPGPGAGVGTAPAEGPDDGHEFTFAVAIRGSSIVEGETHHTDAPESQLFGYVQVRAWSLPAALAKVAQLPLTQWRTSVDNYAQPVPEARVAEALRMGGATSLPDWRDRLVREEPTPRQPGAPRDLYDVALQITDEVLGPGTYAEHNTGNPDPGVQAAIARWERLSSAPPPRKCARCGHDITEYAPGLTLCAVCEDEPEGDPEPPPVAP